jgi:hypothetical protein
LHIKFASRWLDSYFSIKTLQTLSVQKLRPLHKWHFRMLNSQAYIASLSVSALCESEDALQYAALGGIAKKPTRGWF